MILQGPLPSAVDAEEEKVPGDNINVFSYPTLRLYGAPAKMNFTNFMSESDFMRRAG